MWLPWIDTWCTALSHPQKRMVRKTTSRRRPAAISHDSSERSHILEDRMIPPLDVDALRAFELRALELHEFARALPGVVIPLGGLVDFISRRRRGILIRLVRTVVGVETTHDVGGDGGCRPLQTLGGPPSPFHPREVRSKVGRYAAARAQMRPEARQFDRYLLGRLGESSESLRLPRPPPGG